MNVDDQLKLLPDRPGCYLYRNAEGRVIYVGKAINLKNRVRQYFQSSRNLTAKVLAMVTQIASIEHIVTDSEIEALILESNLIKKHKPKYNIRLRDDKQYPYLKLSTNEVWPRIVVTRTMKKDGARYYGPFTSTQPMWETLKLSRRLFPLRTCNDPTKHPKACLQYHIGRCLAPCLASFDQHEAYAQAVKDLGAFLEGRSDEVTGRIRDRMEAAAEDLQFERAAELRDQLFAIEKVTEKQKVLLHDLANLDAISYARGHDEAAVQVFFVREGKVLGRDRFIMAGADEMSGPEILAAFIEQHYNQTDFVPKEILVSEELSEPEILEAWLAQKRGSKVEIRQPRRGDKRELIEMVTANAKEGMTERRQEREQELAATDGAMRELQEALGLERLPYRIECFDVSHVQGSEVVASMVVFEGGRPKKEDYRRFKVRDQNNDFANMADAVSRRFKRGLAEREAMMEGRVRDLEEGRMELVAEEAVEWGDSEAKFAAFPDLLIIDGGKGQLAYARDAMRSLGVEHLRTFGLAKEEELLCEEGREEWIRLPRGSQGLYLLQRIRDEAHRFAITYHRALHRKAATKSRLEEIPGIGPVRRKALLKEFGSVKRIREASLEEIAGVPGMNMEIAERIRDFFAGQR
ncbi:MAG TPA: excinuclease ABC subunit UvrC [Symbiobacteriaceae bacterium]|nr:excinuclease ABC subunit UvrC [Symbiobacteriaceae bacterium]